MISNVWKTTGPIQAFTDCEIKRKLLGNNSNTKQLQKETLKETFKETFKETTHQETSQT